MFRQFFCGNIKIIFNSLLYFFIESIFLSATLGAILGIMVSDTPHYENEVPFEVPEGWVWTTIGEIASSILYGVSESAKETGQYKLLRITDIQNNKVNWETVPFTDYDNNKAQAYLLNDGDILFARTGATVGKSYLVEGLRDSAIYASYLIRVQTSSVILPAYIKFFLKSY